MRMANGFKTLREQYYELVTGKIGIPKDELNEVELEIIDVGYSLIMEKLEDIKILNDEIRRLSIENANLKAYNDDKEYGE